jgi:hypothetical protein
MTSKTALRIAKRLNSPTRGRRAEIDPQAETAAPPREAPKPMRVRFVHPATGLETDGEFALRCPRCLRMFEPDASEQQKNVGDPITVHCTHCRAFVLSWAPPALEREPDVDQVDELEGE